MYDAHHKHSALSVVDLIGRQSRSLAAVFAYSLMQIEGCINSCQVWIKLTVLVATACDEQYICWFHHYSTAIL